MKFIIWAPVYNEKQGGSIILHYLCHYLNTLGYDASIWLDFKPRKRFSIKFFNYFVRLLYRRIKGKTILSCNLITRHSRYSEITKSTIIYPEVVAGNPLGGDLVIRYLLHRPGFHTGVIKYSNSDFFIHYRELFTYNTAIAKSHLLFLFISLQDTFYRYNYNERNGTCLILRKGRNRKILEEHKNAIIVDSLTNKEMNEVFNKMKFCVSYDLDTFYSRYAALCGCISIVVPDVAITAEDWCPDVELRYGIAYGQENIGWAISTVDKLRKHLKQIEDNNLSSVRNFVSVYKDSLKN